MTEAREIHVHTGDGEMATFVARPERDGPFPVALLYMDAIGYREQVRENARRFAEGGFYCVAPDLFHRSGDRLAFDPVALAESGFTGPEADRLKAAMALATPDAVVADTRAVLAEVASDGAAGTGPRVCVGYCMGARHALHVSSALNDEFVATAGIHPGALVGDAPDSPHHDVAGLRGEVYFAFAEIDRTATPELVERFREELVAHGVPGVVETLPGVAHGFAMADLPAYDEAAAEHHFERTLDLWRRSLGREPVAT
jgi:carboxymethylenebutenolidase